jgi:tetratricopeptide (TPR) repeat protein
LDYGMTPAASLAEVWPYAMVGVALLLAAMAALMFRPKEGFLGAAFFILLAPTSSIVPIATEVGAERRMYLPMAALVVMSVVLAHDGLRRLRPAQRARWSVAALLIVCVLLTAGTLSRNAEYSSPMTMAEVTLARRPHARSHAFLAEQLVAAGRRQEAIAEFRAGADGYPLSRFALGQELFVDRQPQEAIDQLRRFVAEAPTLVEVPHAHELIGRALFQQGKLDEAEHEFREILRLTPGYGAAHLRLGDTLNNQGRLDEAAAEYALYLRAVPNDFDALTRMGIAQSRMGQHDKAVAALSSAVEIQPSNSTAHANLANALLNQRNLAAAEREARQAVNLNSRDPVGYELMGLAVAAQGRVVEAREYFEAALKIDPNYAPARADLARLK